MLRINNLGIAQIYPLNLLKHITWFTKRIKYVLSQSKGKKTNEIIFWNDKIMRLPLNKNSMHIVVNFSNKYSNV